MPLRLSAFARARALLVFGLGLVGLAGSDVRGELPFLVGADVSAQSTLEKHGAVYRFEGRRADGISILRGQGYNCFRLRLFVAPDGQTVVTNDLEYTIALAKRVKALKPTRPGSTSPRRGRSFPTTS